MRFVSPKTAQLDNNSDEKRGLAHKIGTAIDEIYITRSGTHNDYSSIPTDVKNMLRPNVKLQLKTANLSFLNDIALGKYTVLSETKNIFTENYELAQYQKIYESILHLHSSKRMFDRKQLSNSLKVLKPYLTSGTFNLNSVIEFVVEPSPTQIDSLGKNESQSNQMQNLYLFNELQLRNQSFYHLFLLHKYPNEIRKEYIKKIVEDIGIIEVGRVKSIVICLLNLCYMASTDWEVSFTFKEFQILAEGILGSRQSDNIATVANSVAPKPPAPQDLGTSILDEPDNGLTARPRKEGSSVDEENVADLVQLVYLNITSKDRSRSTFSKKFKQFLKVIGGLISHKPGGQTLLASGLFGGRNHAAGPTVTPAELAQLNRDSEILNSFILDISKKNKKSFLMKFQRGKEEINQLLGVKQSYLLGVFDIVNSITSTKVMEQTNVHAILSSFFCSKFFKEAAISHEVRAKHEKSYSMVYSFIVAFYKGDIKEILGFLRRYNMQDTYCFVISYHCYISALNGLHHGKTLGSKATDTIAKCLLFPLVQQITSGIYSKDVYVPERFMFSVEKIRSLTQKVSEAIWADTYDLEFLSVFSSQDITEGSKILPEHVFQHKKMRDTSACDRLFKGEGFKVFEIQIEDKLNQYLNEDKPDSQTATLVAAFSKVKKLFYFQNTFYEDTEKPMKEKHTQPTDKQKAESVSCKQLIQSAYRLRDNWEEVRKTLTASIIQSTAKTQYFSKMMKELMQNEMQFFEFLGVKGNDLDRLKKHIYQMMIFVFIYLKELRVYLDLKGSNSTQTVMKNALSFIWNLIKEMIKDHPDKDPFEKIGLKRKIIGLGYNGTQKNYEAQEYKEYVDFLNKYTFLIYNLKHLRSDSKMLNEIIGFLKIYVFVKQQNPHAENKRTREPGRRDDGTNRLPGPASYELYGDLKPESFMELYDYLEELEHSRDLSENYKENILNLFIQILSPHERFKKHIPDIKGLVKLIQRDYSKLDYFIDKLFSRSENASYARANFKNYIASHTKANQEVWEQSETGLHESNILAIPKQDRETLFKRAEDGMLTPSDIFLLLRGRVIRNSYIAFNEIELIFRRLGIRLTEHRLCEFLSAAKLIHSKKTAGFHKLNHSYVEEGEFECLFEYLETSVNTLTKQSLEISPQDLMQFTLFAFLVFAVSALVASSLVYYFYGGDLFGALLCALVPMTSVFMVTRTRIKGGSDAAVVKEAIEKSFTTITNSRVSNFS